MGIIRFLLNRLLDTDDEGDMNDDFDEDFDDDMDDDFDEDPDGDGNDDDDPDDADDVDDDVDVPDNNDQLNFTGLIDKGLKNSRVYQSWQDGVSIFEVKKGDIREIAEHIAEEFEQAFPAIEKDWFSGGFATITRGNGRIFYDVVDIMRNNANGFGADNLVGSIAHEMGHNIVDRVFADGNIELTQLQSEIGADYLEGVAFGLAGVNPQEKYEWLRSFPDSGPGYLPKEGRIDVIGRGVEWGERLRFVGQHMPENLINFSSNEKLQAALKHVIGLYTDIG